MDVRAALVPLCERTVAGKQLLELRVRGLEDGLVREGRSHAVASLDLVRVGRRFAREHARVDAQPGQLVAEPAVLDLAQQGIGLDHERAGLDQRRRLDLRRPFRRAEVRVHDPLHVPPDLQTEADVALCRRLAHGGEPTRVTPPAFARSYTFIQSFWNYCEIVVQLRGCGPLFADPPGSPDRSRRTTEEQAQRTLAAVLRDEPDWADDIYVEAFEFVVQPEE